LIDGCKALIRRRRTLDSGCCARRRHCLRKACG
jgi:hypothetical protein